MARPRVEAAPAISDDTLQRMFDAPGIAAAAEAPAVSPELVDTNVNEKVICTQALSATILTREALLKDVLHQLNQAEVARMSGESNFAQTRQLRDQAESLEVKLY